MKFEIVDFPWPHGYSESFVDQDRADQMGRDFPEWDDEVWDTAGKTFNTEYGHKKTIIDPLQFGIDHIVFPEKAARDEIEKIISKKKNKKVFFCCIES